MRGIFPYVLIGRKELIEGTEYKKSRQSGHGRPLGNPHMINERRDFLRLMGAAALMAGGCGVFGGREEKAGKLLIAHRGASAYAPENTLEAFRLAVEQGADYVEHDLHVTRDGVLVCLHDSTLERTTDVEEVYPDRFREETVNGEVRRRWPVTDFDLAELQRLDAGSWFDAKFKGARIPTFAEMIDALRGRTGLYVEIKSPESYWSRGVEIERMVLEDLRKAGLDRPGADPATPVLIQTFSPASLKKMAHELKTDLQLGLLIGGSMRAHWLSPEGLEEARGFVSRIGPEKGLLDPATIAEIHRLGMTVAPYTFRSSDTGAFKDVKEQMAHFLYTLGVDGAITDNPDEFPRSA